MQCGKTFLSFYWNNWIVFSWWRYLCNFQVSLLIKFIIILFIIIIIIIIIIFTLSQCNGVDRPAQACVLAFLHSLDDSRTSRQFAYAQSQVWQIWLAQNKEQFMLMLRKLKCRDSWCWLKGARPLRTRTGPQQKPFKNDV